ncbi:MAG: VOC family protein [Bacteroidota bacterium]
MKTTKKSSIQKIRPFLWFDNQAEEAAKFYTGVFKNSRILNANPMTVTFVLDGLEFMALNGGPHHKFTEAISFFVHCTTQKEIDGLWKKLIADGGQESQCGRLFDKYGVSWQIIPHDLGKLLGDKDRVKANRVMQAMLQMKKIDIAGLKKAHKK